MSYRDPKVNDLSKLREEAVKLKRVKEYEDEIVREALERQAEITKAYNEVQKRIDECENNAKKRTAELNSLVEKGQLEFMTEDVKQMACEVFKIVDEKLCQVSLASNYGHLKIRRWSARYKKYSEIVLGQRPSGEVYAEFHCSGNLRVGGVSAFGKEEILKFADWAMRDYYNVMQSTYNAREERLYHEGKFAPYNPDN